MNNSALSSCHSGVNDEMNLQIYVNIVHYTYRYYRPNQWAWPRWIRTHWNLWTSVASSLAKRLWGLWSVCGALSLA